MKVQIIKETPDLKFKPFGIEFFIENDDDLIAITAFFDAANEDVGGMINASDSTIGSETQYKIAKNFCKDIVSTMYNQGRLAKGEIISC